MTDRDPKDMTASEMLRYCYSRKAPSSCFMCHKVFNIEECEEHFCHDVFEALADKIDAELAEARELSLRQGAELWAKANGWPDFKDGEDFGAWLDRCAIPRPRFEDGEPVQMGDEIAIGGGSIDVNEAVMLLDGSGYRLLHSTDVSASAIEDRVKRPAPEVLGADGKPIKVGDAMWSLSGAGPLTVTSLHTDDPTPDGGDSPWADLDDDGLYSWIYAGSLTHTQPDTQERIDADKKKENSKYWGCCFYCNNCPAEIDGKKPRERYGLLNCSIAQGMDIARRQYELDKRTGGDA